MRLKHLFLVMALLAGHLTMATAQEMMMPPIPQDPEVKVGRLDNGLTYYIRKNNWPENVANFYIAQRVGSIQEDDDQRGLAHFLEHMAFNGSEHFKGNDLIEYTRSLGVEFGSNLNAYTSIDQTVYRICDVPSKRQSALDSCLLILKDWSNGLLLEQEEIQKERGVIHEEWRLRSSAQQRMLERALPTLYPGSKYGHRMPIGLMEIIDNFEPKFLQDYYHKWYRPDNQAIIVVGDIDVAHTEAEVKRLFGGIEVPADAAQVVDEQVPDNDEAIYICEKDKEQQMTLIFVSMKHDAVEKEQKKTVDYLLMNYAKQMACTMLNKRFEELAEQPDCPFVAVQADDSEYWLSRTKEAFQLVVVPKEGQERAALAVAMKEAKRAKEFGFTATEYERVKSDYLSALEKEYVGRNKVNNHTYGVQYTANYIEGEPIPSIEQNYQLMNQIVPMLPVEIINEYTKEIVTETDTNLVVMSFEQEKDGKEYLTPEMLRTAIQEGRVAPVEAYVDNVKEEPLVDEATLPKAGTIKKETEDKALGYKELTLSNGARVILKKTDFKDDEVQMQAWGEEGTANYAAADFSNLKLLDVAVEYSGLGNFSHTELQKALAGKVAGVGASYGTTLTTLSGQCVPKDLETMVQLVYLYFTNIAKDEKSYENVKGMLKVALQNQGLTPEAAFNDSVTSTVHNHDARYDVLKVADVEAADYDRMLQIGRELLANPQAFTFVFAGNFDEAQLRQLLCRYIAPLKGGKVQPQRDVFQRATGHTVNSFRRKMETPKANTIHVWWSNCDYTLENSVKADAAGQVLSMFYLKTIREDASAAYSCGAAGKLGRVGSHEYATVQVYCPMNPEKADTAQLLIAQGMAEAAVKIDAEQLAKVKEYMLKQADEDLKKNGTWLSAIQEQKRTGVDFLTGYKQTVEALTPEAIARFIKDVVLKDGNHIEVTMMPE